jgi:hypothetical protein
MIKATIIADSKNKQGDRITTMVVTMPRIILAEFNTHRMFSRNSASSRAIPFEKMVKSVKENPFIPIAWQKDHKGMQGSEYFDDSIEIEINPNTPAGKLLRDWHKAKNLVIEQAIKLNETGLTKQLCNRLLEPFMWHTVIVTATEWENFFALRCPQYSIFNENMPMEFRSKKDLLNFVNQIEAPEFKGQYDNLTDLDWLQINKGQAEIHMMALAEAMWDALNESTPKELKDGEWHIPYADSFDLDYINAFIERDDMPNVGSDKYIEEQNILKVKIATAHCARVSYTTPGEVKKSSKQWQKLYPEVKVIDPDGWNRNDFENSWNELITLNEYNNRLIRSTCEGSLYKIPLLERTDYDSDIDLHNKLAKSGHWSPFEHCARAMSEEEYKVFYRGSLTKFKTKHDLINIDGGWCYNFKGFIQYRYLQNNNIIN